jgi:aryl-alcohol dehydrogenase-like predicted oxidoreductase
MSATEAKQFSRMPHRRLGRSELSLSAIGLGCMGMSEFYGTTDDDESIATIHRALERGMNFFDTADMYGVGRNEELVGRALRGHRQEVVLATKFGNVRSADGKFLGVNGRPEYVQQACEASLRRLGVDVIDLYYQHRVDPEVAIEETVGAMASLVRQGKVRFLGLSEAAPATIRRAAKVHPIAALQTEYSLWSRDPEAEIIPTCRELGIGFVPYSPLGRGFLTGKYRSETDLEDNDFRRSTPRFQGENLRRNLSLVERLEKIAAEKKCTAAQLALGWVLAQGDDIVPIPGTRRREYLDENVDAIHVTLTPEDLARINQELPPGIAAGERYNTIGMDRLNR